MHCSSTSFDVTQTEWYVFPFCSPDVNFDELSRCTDDYNGAMLKAVCVEAVSQKSILSFRVKYDYVYLVKWLSPPLTFLVSLRNGTGEKRTRQTLCDKRDNNFVWNNFFAELHPSLNRSFCQDQKTLNWVKVTTKHISNRPVSFVTHTSVLPFSSFCRPVA